MNRTFDALLGRGLPSLLAANLVTKGETVASLQKKTADELTRLGMSQSQISAIIDNRRPDIPSALVRELLTESRSTCCCCHHPERPYVIHHIVKWAECRKHEKHNLAVLCVQCHNLAHATFELSLNLTAERIQAAKKKWIKQAALIEKNYIDRIANIHWRSVRWFWVHVDNLQEKLRDIEVRPSYKNDEWIVNLRQKGYINHDGDLTPRSAWPDDEAKLSYLFDTGDRQNLAKYVSDLMLLWARHTPILDINDMLDQPETLRAYVEQGSWVYLRARFRANDNKDVSDPRNDWVEMRCERTHICIEFSFNAWTSLNQSSRGIYVRSGAERSVLGQVVEIGHRDGKEYIRLSPMGTSPDFVLHHPTQGDWAEGQVNDGFKRRQKLAAM